MTIGDSKTRMNRGNASVMVIVATAVIGLGLLGWLLWPYLVPNANSQWTDRIPEIDRSNLTERARKLMDSCEESIRINPEDPSAWGLLGRACLSHQFESEAKTCFEIAAELEPDNHEWYYSQALTLPLEENEEAIRLIRKAVELCDRDLEQLQCRLAEMLFDEAEFDASKELVTEVLKAFPLHARANMVMARLYLIENKLEQSLKCAEIVIAEQPNRKETLRLLSQIHSRLGNATEANQFASRAEDPQSYNPAWPDSIFQKVYALRKDVNKLVDDALRLPPSMINERVRVLKEAVAEEPHEPNWFGYLGQTYLQLRQFQSAEQVLVNGIRLHPESAILLYTLGLVHLNQGKFKEAIPVLEKAVSVKPDFDQAYLNLGIAYRENNELEKSVDALKKSVAILPGNLKTQLNLAVSLEQNDQVKEAIEAFEECLRLDINSAEVHYLFGKLFVTKGNDKRKAKEYLTRALQLNPGFFEARQLLESLVP